MSERFDDLLSGVVDSAGRAAREPGADAARKRGRQRRNRQRVAASTLSVALLGVAGGVAAVNVHGSNGVPTAPVTGTHSVVPVTSGPYSASPSATSSSAPTSTPTATTGSGSSTATARVSSSAASHASSSVSVDPDQYVAGAWLSAGQMPLYAANVTMWQSTTAAGTRVGGEVYADPAKQASTWCTDFGRGGLASLQPGLLGGQIEMFDASNSDQILANGVIPATTFQSALFYPNAADAVAAMDGLASSFARVRRRSPRWTRAPV
jgi:hypothetical protein